MRDPVFSSEATVILWLMFDYYKGKLGNKKALKKSAIAFCLKTLQLILEKESNLPDWLIALDFFIFYKMEKKRVLYAKYSPRLFRIVTDKHEPTHCITAFNLLIDLLKGCQIESNIILNRCLNSLSDLANDATISLINQLNAIHSIMANYPQEAEQCFYRLFDFLENSDIAVMLKAWSILWNVLFGISNGFPELEDMGNKFVRRALNTMADQDLELGLRLKAIDFMMTRFKKNAYGFSTGEIHAKAYLHLVELVKSQQFLLSDYLESLRLYFKVMNVGAKKTRSIQLTFANASNA
jgi:hypothetical protein